MKEIPLTKGLVALVDDADYEWLMQWKWHAIWNSKMRSFYAVRNEGPRTQHKIVRMHRQILGLEVGDPRLGDHVETGQTLDNRRSNLRIANKAENTRNQRIRRDNTSGFKGAWLSFGKWQAEITVNCKRIRLGRFATPEEAHAAYCEAAKQYHGEFARFE